MKRETVDKIRAALAARTPGGWQAPKGSRYGSVIVPFGDPEISPAFLRYADEERAKDLAEHRARWDAMTDAERATYLEAGFNREHPVIASSCDAYGGDLVCESIRPEDAELVAAAPAWLAELVADAERAEAVLVAAGVPQGPGLAWLADGGPPPEGLELSEVITGLARELVAAHAAIGEAQAEIVRLSAPEAGGAVGELQARLAATQAATGSRVEILGFAAALERAAAELERAPALAGPGPVCRLCHGDRDRCGHFVGGGAG